VAYKNGHRVASHRIETTGATKRLQLIADAETWRADGEDLQHVRVLAVDGKGRRVPTAQQKLTFSVEGNARIVAVDNGNNSSDELHATGERSLYNGSALVILRAGKAPGKVTLTVKDAEGRTAKLKLATR